MPNLLGFRIFSLLFLYGLALTIDSLLLFLGPLRQKKNGGKKGSRRAVLFSPLEPEHLNLLMSIAPMNSSSARSRTGPSLAEVMSPGLHHSWMHTTIFLLNKMQGNEAKPYYI
jgi:hypothetical protein